MLARLPAAYIAEARSLTYVSNLLQMRLPETSDVACLSTDGEHLYAVGHMHGIYVIDPRARRAADKLRSLESQGVSTSIRFKHHIPRQVEAQCSLMTARRLECAYGL